MVRAETRCVHQEHDSQQQTHFDHTPHAMPSALLEELKEIAATRGAYLIFVQADTGAEDEAAIALYNRLGTREDVLHFDIPVEEGDT